MAETKAARAAQRRDALAYPRRAVAIRAARLETVPDDEARRVSFHALNLAELVAEEGLSDG